MVAAAPKADIGLTTGTRALYPLLYGYTRLQRKHGREPILWLDKVYINQSDIARALKGLPVFVFSCKRLMILAGNTYPYARCQSKQVHHINYRAADIVAFHCTYLMLRGTRAHVHYYRHGAVLD